jgi:hypothetical protein
VKPLHRFRFDLAHALARQPERLADRGQRHRRLPVQAEAAHDDRAPLRWEAPRRASDELGVLAGDDRVDRLLGHVVDENVFPAERAPRADRILERDIVAIAGAPVLGHRAPHHTRVAGDESLHAAARPPRGVRQELRAVFGIEPEGRLEQPQPPFGFEVLTRGTGVQEFAGHPRDVVKSRLHGRPSIAELLSVVAS